MHYIKTNARAIAIKTSLLLSHLLLQSFYMHLREMSNFNKVNIHIIIVILRKLYKNFVRTFAIIASLLLSH